MSSAPDTDDCGFLGGRLTLRQPRRGHRAGTDAVLLAAATDLRAGEHLFDVGAGAGAAALAVLARVEGGSATLIERDGPTAELAAHNVEANGFALRARVCQADAFDKPACARLLGGPADVVICNPPFYQADRVRISSDPHRRTSHVLSEQTHGAWLIRLHGLLSPKGRLVLIHRPEVLPDVLAAAVGRFGAIRVRPVHAREDQPAIRMIVTATRGSRAPFEIAPATLLHDAGGALTPSARRLHEGGALT